jgi:hypothetical protein
VRDVEGGAADLRIAGEPQVEADQQDAGDRGDEEEIELDPRLEVPD